MLIQRKLQEYLQQKNQKAPNYIAKSVEGPDHNPQHTIAVVAMNKTLPLLQIANEKPNNKLHDKP